MDIQKEIRLVAKVLLADEEVKYTSAKSGDHTFNFKGDTIRVYDKPEQVKRFTAVLSGKDWDEKGSTSKSLIRFDMAGKTVFATGQENASLGKPVVWNSLPSSLQKKIKDAVSGKID